MAIGDFYIFEEFVKDVGSEVHNLDADTFKWALITNVLTPTAADATPRWADYSANEVSGTGYVAGGASVNATYAEVDGVGTFDFPDTTWAQNGAGPINARWGILYNDSATNKEAVGFVDLGGVISLRDGAITIKTPAAGAFKLTVVNV